MLLLCVNFTSKRCVQTEQYISYRKAWKEYFEAEGSIRVAFWSALAQNSQENICTSHSDSALESATEGIEAATELSRTAVSDDAAGISQDSGSDTCRLLTRDELIQQLLSISPVPQGQVTTVGMVRMIEKYQNTFNAIL